MAALSTDSSSAALSGAFPLGVDALLSPSVTVELGAVLSLARWGSTHNSYAVLRLRPRQPRLWQPFLFPTRPPPLGVDALALDRGAVASRVATTGDFSPPSLPVYSLLDAAALRGALLAPHFPYLGPMSGTGGLYTLA